MTVRGLLVAALWIGLLSTPIAWSDCPAELAGAKSVLAESKAKALQNQHQDPQAVAIKLKGYVDRMAAGKCQGEILQLMTFIQGEQQMYPDPRKNPGAYDK